MTLISFAAFLLTIAVPTDAWAQSKNLAFLPKCNALNYDPHFQKADENIKKVGELQKNLKKSFAAFETSCNKWKLRKQDAATIKNLTASRDTFSSDEHAYRTAASSLNTDLQQIAPVATAYAKDAPECGRNLELMRSSMVQFSAHFLKRGLDMINTTCKPK